MKPIENIDLQKCYEAAEAEVKADLEALVTKQIKAQLMTVAQLKIRANNTVTEGEKLTQQLEQKTGIIAKIKSGDWSAVADSAKDRDSAAQQATPPTA